MEDVMIEPGPKTPGIELKSSGEFRIWGRSIPENSVEFYKDIYSWLEQYNSSPADKTTMSFQLEYFNTSSSKCVLDILRRLEQLKRSGKSEVKVRWLYDEDDEDMMEAGDDYQTLVDLDFEISQAEE